MALNAAKKIIPVDNHAYIFFDEALNDFLSSHVMMMLGSSRIALVALRAVIENFLYYFFYIDHKVEYTLWKQGKFRKKFSDLFDYLKEHPLVAQGETSEYVAVLQNEYSTLSMAVHGSSTKFMMTQQDNFPHIFQSEISTISQWNCRQRQVYKSIIALIITFHKEHFITASHKHERQIIEISLGERQTKKFEEKFSISL